MLNRNQNQKLNLILFIIFGIVLYLLMTSCEEYNTQITPPTISNDIKELDSTGYNGVEVVSYDSCEYIVTGYGHARWGSHKGNCKNPIHYKN